MSLVILTMGDQQNIIFVFSVALCAVAGLNNPGNIEWICAISYCIYLESGLDLTSLINSLTYFS